MADPTDTDPAPKRVAICYGPSWWGDPTVDPAGRPLRLEDPTIRRDRAEAAAAERAGIVEKLSLLPAGCLIVHTASRGAGELFATVANGLGLPAAAWPAWPSLGGVALRDDALVDLAVGLDHLEWGVKGITAQPESQPYMGVTADLSDTLNFGIALAEAGFKVGSAHPFFPPEPEPDTDPPADPEADPDN